MTPYKALQSIPIFHKPLSQATYQWVQEDYIDNLSVGQTVILVSKPILVYGTCIVEGSVQGMHHSYWESKIMSASGKGILGYTRLSTSLHFTDLFRKVTQRKSYAKKNT